MKYIVETKLTFSFLNVVTRKFKAMRMVLFLLGGPALGRTMGKVTASVQVTSGSGLGWDLCVCVFFTFFWYWGLNPGPCAPPLEPCPYLPCFVF
jgi:hypothetical protein